MPAQTCCQLAFDGLVGDIVQVLQACLAASGIAGIDILQFSPSRGQETKSRRDC